MKEELITEIQQHMLRILDNSQMEKLKHVLRNCLQNYEVVDSTEKLTKQITWSCFCRQSGSKDVQKKLWLIIVALLRK